MNDNTTNNNSELKPNPLPPWKASFLSTCLTHRILQFGTFKLKSHRISPYFFNAGLFHRADLLRCLATAYAHTILEDEVLDFEVLFGPAYKGIPLATATTQTLAELSPERFGQVSYAFNRKEVKDHGEGGNIVGCPLRGKRVVVVDDVITAGTAIREAIEVIRAEGGVLVGIVVALDRMETAPVPLTAPGSEGEDVVVEESRRESAIGRLRAEYGIPIRAVLTLDDIIRGQVGRGGTEEEGLLLRRRLYEYRKQYGVDAP
ncbi:MAG: hypothetical protein M1823_003866 [Watsoniomyces obsoletus]|nr:MAG: hypothetical protein M1823_003866 [Watsoniomyces obsoletus]